MCFGYKVCYLGWAIGTLLCAIYNPRNYVSIQQNLVPCYFNSSSSHHIKGK